MGKKQQGDEEHKGVDNTVILFTALNLILLTLFIYLNSISIKDDKKERAALGSLTGAFGILPGGISPTKGDTPLPYDAPLLTLDDVSDDQMLGRLKEFLEDRGVTKGIVLNANLNELIISLAGDVVFDAGSPRLKPEVLPVLDMIGNLVIRKGYHVRIEGHSDSSLKDAGKSKWELSANRAVSVLRYLSDNYFVDPDSVSAVGYGPYRPLVPNNSAANRRKNRRVEMILMMEHG